MPPILRCLLASLVAFLALTAQGASETRAAFLVGNGAYEHASDLRNPSADVALIGETLEALDFTVERYEDLTRAEIGKALTAFLDAHAEADVT
ncbi:MAG: caspase family protein, partial [Pseudomonadota bacterium]